MKRTIIVLIIILIGVNVEAQSVWTGNAAVGGLADFPGFSSTFRAASNSFPVGTILEVVNPRGGLSVDVEVIDRLEFPGVFILLERGAAEAINLPTDHVLPVRVSPKKTNKSDESVPAVAHGKTVTDDPDYNPAASLGDKNSDLQNLPLPPEEALVEDFVREPETIIAFDLSQIPHSQTPIDTDEEPVEESKENTDTDEEPVEEPKENTDTDEEPVEEPKGNTDTDDEPVEELKENTDTDDEPVEELKENTDTDDEPVEEPKENTDTDDEPVEEPTVFFLMPSDLRPPEPVESPVEKTVPIPPVPEKTPTPQLPVEEAAIEASSELERVVQGDSRPYVQVAAYRNLGVLNDAARSLKNQAPGYPLSYAVGADEIGPVYRLLVGPLRPAEKGAVLQTARSSNFPDAFLYSP